jgi:hypothetical protein
MMTRVYEYPKTNILAQKACFHAQVRPSALQSYFNLKTEVHAELRKGGAI